MSEANNVDLRHTVATLAYRAARAVRNAPADFGLHQIGQSKRHPVTILAHMGDLMEWALRICDGDPRWEPVEPKPWEQEVERFFGALAALDTRLASDKPLACSQYRLFQGPIADALTHVGQLSMLRRFAKCSTGGENFYIADIQAGRVGQDQAKPLREFE